MNRHLILAAAAVALSILSVPAFAGGKRDGEKCHVSRSCASNLCVRLHPQDKFGECCTPQECPELGRQCGFAPDNCGIPVNCGDCSPGECIDFQCVTTTTSTTTTLPPTTTTIPLQTTTTTAPSCIGVSETCAGPEDPNCCEGSTCFDVESGPTGFVCVTCVAIDDPCTTGGSPCCNGGSCLTDGGGPICLSVN